MRCLFFACPGADGEKKPAGLPPANYSLRGKWEVNASVRNRTHTRKHLGSVPGGKFHRDLRRHVQPLVSTLAFAGLPGMPDIPGMPLPQILSHAAQRLTARMRRPWPWDWPA